MHLKSKPATMPTKPPQPATTPSASSDAEVITVTTLGLEWVLRCISYIDKNIHHLNLYWLDSIWMGRQPSRPPRIIWMERQPSRPPRIIWMGGSHHARLAAFEWRGSHHARLASFEWRGSHHARLASFEWRGSHHACLAAFEWRGSHHARLAATRRTRGCHYDNPGCPQWSQSSPDTTQTPRPWHILNIQWSHIPWVYHQYYW